MSSTQLTCTAASMQQRRPAFPAGAWPCCMHAVMDWQMRRRLPSLPQLQLQAGIVACTKQARSMDRGRIRPGLLHTAHVAHACVQWRLGRWEPPSPAQPSTPSAHRQDEKYSSTRAPHGGPAMIWTVYLERNDLESPLPTTHKHRLYDEHHQQCLDSQQTGLSTVAQLQGGR